ncbi:MAG: D-2-hydroxyacid dehydrogenase [Eubacterium sp.]|nr:D-2-hydroxyacid dehydrogenase [Eubacterium sp.]
MILTTIPVTDLQKQQLLDAAGQEKIVFTDKMHLWDEDLAAAEIILGNIPNDKLPLCRNLKWYQLYNAGADDVVRLASLPAEVILTNASGAYGTVIAEHMLGMILMLYKHLDQYYVQQQSRIWKSLSHPRILSGENVLVAGCGNLGSSLAEKLQALGCHVTGFSASGTTKYPSAYTCVYPTDQLNAHLPEADMLVLMLPLTNQTRGFLSEERMRLLPQRCVLVNAGRGATVDTDALTAALREKRISGAVLDVTDPEPLPADHPLWGLDNVFITPHISGNNDVPENEANIFRIALGNLDNYLHGRPLNHVVDRRKGY